MLPSVVLANSENEGVFRSTTFLLVGFVLFRDSFRICANFDVLNSGFCECEKRSLGYDHETPK